MRKRSKGTKQTRNPMPASSLTLQPEAGAPEYYVRQEAIPLPYGLKGEQQEIDTWKTLINDAEFRADVKQVQDRLGPSYWQTLSHFKTISQQWKAA